MKVWRLIAAGFGSGLAPKAPGTFGSFAGLVVGCLLLLGGHIALLIGLYVATVLGLYAIRQLPDATQDPGWIVIDEIAGQMLALLALSHFSLLGAALAFGLFRLFDIFKPGPVGWVDQRHDEYGVMGDDLVAGALAFIVLLLLRLVLPL